MGSAEALLILSSNGIQLHGLIPQLPQCSSMELLSQIPLYIQRNKRSFYALISVLSICLLAYNSGAVFWTNVPIPATNSPENSGFSPENVAVKSRKVFSVKEDSSRAKLSTHFPLLYKTGNLAISPHRIDVNKSTGAESKRFEDRVVNFFEANSCKFRFFMTWISSIESFGSRELFALHSLFKTHPNACLIIASGSLDSSTGMKTLKPFSDKGFKLTAISPDFNFLFRGTPAEAWYNQLMRGDINPGDVPLGQNLSNLLRLGLLYRFGGIYIDTDVIILRPFDRLKNAIGAQTLDVKTGNWSRLNNAVLIFDQGHPLVYKFIQEFALTFDGNKWGHNGPYLVSRVVNRVTGRPGYDFTVLPPMAFYPVDWSRIGSLFEGPRSLRHSKWLTAKLKQIRSRCFAVHLWNKQSRGIVVQKGSVIQHILLGSGRVFEFDSSAV